MSTSWKEELRKQRNTPRPFVKLWSRASKRQLRADGVFWWHQEGEIQYVFASEGAEDVEDEELPQEEIGGSQGSESVIGEGSLEGGVTDKDKEALQKLHRGIGHPLFG